MLSDKKFKIICAPDSFKNSISSIDVCAAMKKGLNGIGLNNIISIPIADGGENTIMSIISSTKSYELRFKKVHDSFGEIIDGYIGWNKRSKTAIVEMAVATGLQKKKNAMEASSFGTGELIGFALELGAKKIYLAVGGTSSVDGGIGAANALGYEFLDKEGHSIPLNGRGLSVLKKIKTDKVDKRIRDCRFIILTDVNNPLYGPNGAAYVFAPQKGASEKEVVLLDKGLLNFAEIIKNEFGKDISVVPGSGAAGGIGGGSLFFFNSEIYSGIDHILNIVRFKNRIKDADLIITGEGQFDNQSMNGKVVSGILKKAGKIPVGIICGIKKANNDNFVFINEIKKYALSIDDSINNASKYIEKATQLSAIEFLKGKTK